MISKIIFMPIGLLLGTVLAKRVGETTFVDGWERTRGTKPPTATTEIASWPEVVAAAALRGSIIAVTAATFTRAGATGYRYITGFWPGEKTRQPAARLESRGD
ncbi:MAG: DUF4235 domain-containing protein [Actinobacteria bacterium]|uniref:Unannotated protein n=1 Tax=freshwater metagenome TaxID=449393 RepID=A0A6J5Z791_9ZZZZ|nr:DUF4235 domain-containing protein [Actinomycetota bacterium]